jgi:phosphohistidine phosphatase
VSKILWILRHGDAEPHDAKPDPERQLTPRGEQQSRDAGAALAALGVELAAAFTSPKVRARDTALLACESLGAEPVEHGPLSAGFGADDARELLGGIDDGERILVVGHEPDLSQTVHDLTGARVDLKKGGVAAVRADGTRAELIVLMRPRELNAIAQAGAQVGPS